MTPKRKMPRMPLSVMERTARRWERAGDKYPDGQCPACIWRRLHDDLAEDSCNELCPFKVVCSELMADHYDIDGVTQVRRVARAARRIVTRERARRAK